MENSFDYIIIGAGSAGCVLAHRLSEDPKNKVLILEAGGKDKSFVYHIPFGVVASYIFQLGNWGFRAKPMKNADNRTIYYPRGKVLGGSSSVNAMIYMRGHHQDYDQWEALGNKGWSFADILPYFKKAENQERGPSKLHEVGGPLNVSDQRGDNFLIPRFLDAARAQGYEMTDDFNGEQQDGFGLFQVTCVDGKRCSAAKGYLHPILSRPNLTLITEAHVSKVLIEGNRAMGVKVSVKGKVQQFLVGKEVLLSAGAIQSPQILMLSGVGSKYELENFGIHTIMDLPGVGKNLQDHTANRHTFQGKGGYSISIHWKSAYNFIKAIFSYLSKGRGLLASNVAEAGGFVRTVPQLSRPDVQYHFEPARAIDGEPKMKQIVGDGFTAIISVLNPYSRGEVRLKSSNPLDAPIIDLRFFEDERDLETALRGFKLIRNVLKSAPLQPYTKGELTPGELCQTDEEIKEFLKNTVETIYHGVGTCKMGHDPMAVVDDRLRVRGIRDLRVVDASIMPTIVGGNTNAPTIMIAEKAADMILEDHA
jgi:choline dehydrogenase